VTVPGDPRGWQEISTEDPEWVVLSLPRGKHGGWDPAELQATGELTVSRLLEVARRHAGPVGSGRVVDVGCGVGRLSHALADRFERVVGIDVTPAMLERAAELTRRENVTFLRADIATDEVPAAKGADVVISERVVQHLDPEELVPHLRALVGLLRPGGVAVVQVPVALPWLVRLQPRRRVYGLLRRCGLPPRVLYWRLGLHPMRMRAVPPAEVGRAVEGIAEIVGVERQHEPAFDVAEAVIVLRRAA
jgi:SAM-dependent methyltransferase